MNDVNNQRKKIEIPLKSLICCPYCHSSLNETKSYFECKKCNLNFPIKDGIYFFNIKSKVKESLLFKKIWEEQLNNIEKYKKPTISQSIDTREILKLSHPIKNKILLDAGCGTGLSTLNLINKGADIIFLDVIPESLEFVQAIISLNKIKSKTLFIVGDIINLPLKSKSVDIVWSGGVLEHFYSIKRPYIELYRVLKNKGDLIFTIPNKFGLQRIFTSIREKLISYPEGHYEKGFSHYQLSNLFPKKHFSSYKIILSGIEQTYYDILIPTIKVKLPHIFFLFYKYSIIFLSKIIPLIKFSFSWFLLYGKKR